MSLRTETNIHPAIQYSADLFKETPYIHANGPHLMQEGITYVLENGANCQLFANFTESLVHKRQIPPWMLSQEKFEMVDGLYIPVEQNEARPGDVFLFGKDEHSFDPRDLHQAVFTGSYEESNPILVHMVGNKNNHREDGTLIQKIPGPRKWTLPKFFTYPKYAHLRGIRRLHPDAHEQLPVHNGDEI